MVENRIQSHRQKSTEREVREQQTYAFQRNQVIGLVIVAGGVCLWWLLHTNPKWIFPAGWWRW